ncbi:MAG TPA: DUF2442 domain-containing protein [Bdellovibrionota bacterium]|nr:DUF2442 domain-containing protein [Bdellovibrionota bacterium]
MSHPIYKVLSFEISGDYRLRVSFDDGTTQDVDLSNVLFGDLYGPLRDLAVFRSVRVDPEVKTLVWPNGADFDPAMLHDWPKYKKAFADRALKWK